MQVFFLVFRGKHSDQSAARVDHFLPAMAIEIAQPIIPEMVV